MSLDISQALKYTCDQCYSVPASLGLHPHAVSVVTITNSGVDVFGIGGTRTRTDVRLTLTGNLPLQADGYLNPAFEQVKANDIFLSGGLLTDKDYKLGPIVFPYTFNSVSGGTDETITNPNPVSGATLQLFFKVVGPVFPDGIYFRRKWSKEDSKLSYTIYLENTAEVPA